VPVVLLLAGCGDGVGSAAADPTDGPSQSTESTESATPTEETSEPVPELPDWPACGGVWVGDARLPAAYKGCLDGDQEVKADNLPCESGQRIVRYADRFFAVPGGKIYQTAGPLEKDKGYLDTIATCRG
jgi:hypothetical protein